MKQLSLFPKTIKSAYLEADSAKKAFYDISIVENEGYYCVKKRSGIADSNVLDERSWGFNNYASADKRFKNKISEKINPRSNRKRIYNIIDYLWICICICLKMAK